jgi:hypothetical protein
VAKLHDREVCGEGCLSSFLADNTNTNISGLNHTNIVASIANTKHTLLRIVFDKPCNISLNGGHCQYDDEVSIVAEEIGLTF